MGYNFALAYYVAGVVFVFVDNVILVYDVVTMFYQMLMPDYLLRTRAIKNLPVYGVTLLAAAVASAIHKKTPLLEKILVHVTWYARRRIWCII